MTTQPFRYTPDILVRYPAARVGVVHATGLANGPSPAGLLARYTAAQREAAARLAATPVSEWPSIAAWRRAFSAFGVKPTQYRSAPESLLRRLDKQGEIPSINTLVDIGNLVSITHGLPVAVIDLAVVRPPISVQFAAGSEQFIDLGADESSAAEPGEVIFVDAAGAVVARRWCWRQSGPSATSPSTTEALVVIEGQHDGAEADVAIATEAFVALLRDYQPAAAVAAGHHPG